jgi:poly(hydroxyalkanoate) depolymerase family esterase
MSEIFARGMATATKLTQAGKLTEATALIQSILRSGSPRGEARTEQFVSHRTVEIEGTATVLSSEEANANTAPSSLSKTGGDTPHQFDFKRIFDKLTTRKRAQDAEVVQTYAPGQFIAGTYGNAAGHRTYKLYVPTSQHSGPRPLVVMLHGCTQSPDDFASGTRINICAEEHGCFVVYPEQTSAANASKCWNWFNTSDQQRGRGEPSIIADLTLDLLKKYPIDHRRVYIAGFSAGGAAAAVLGEAYPDLYAAVGIHSGLACGAARDMPSAFIAMGGHGQSARPVHDQVGVAFVPTIVFHGDNDRTVHPRNGVEVITRAKRAENLQSLTENGADNGRTFTRAVHRNSTGKAVLEEWVIHGAGHAWSGGSTSGSFADQAGPDASREMLRFFLAQSLTADR